MATGIFNTSAFTADHKADSFARAITRLMPAGEAPLFGMTSYLEEETAVQTEHGFFTKTMIFPSLNLDAAVADGTQNIFTVASTANIIPNSVFRAQSTGEIVMVNAVLSPTSVQVTRGVGNVAAAAIADNVNLYQVGTAFEEASNRPNALQINPVKITNLTQIFRKSWAVSNSAAATSVIAGDTIVAESRSDCAALHAVDIETALIFGQKSQGTLNGQPMRLMDGLISIVGNLSYYPPSYSAANVFTAGSTTNYTQLEAMFDPCFNQSTDPKVGNMRVIFGGGEARKVINNIGRLNSQYQMTNKENHYGLQFSSFHIARGAFNFIEHPLFNSNSDYSKLAIAVDLSSFKLAYLQGRKTERKEFGMDGTPVDDGRDACGGTLTTELTCVVKNPPANAVVWNLTAAAAG